MSDVNPYEPPEVQMSRTRQESKRINVVEEDDGKASWVNAILIVLIIYGVFPATTQVGVLVCVSIHYLNEKAGMPIGINHLWKLDVLILLASFVLVIYGAIKLGKLITQRTA